MPILTQITNTLAIKTIESYQHYLSPIKGFKCAAGQLHGGSTCSGAVKSIIQNQGLISGIPDIYQQFSSCHDAAKILASDPNRPITTAFCCIIPILL